MKVYACDCACVCVVGACTLSEQVSVRVYVRMHASVWMGRMCPSLPVCVGAWVRARSSTRAEVARVRMQALRSQLVGHEAVVHEP
jgi:hypothetical protein